MISKKALLWWIPSVIILSFIAINSFGFKNEPSTKYEKIITAVADLLEQEHFSPKKIDDAFSKEVFKKYINDIDPDKSILLQDDINALKKFETSIDNELHGDKVQFVSAVNEIFNTRVKEASDIYQSILSKPFDFSKEEIANLNGEKLPFPKNVEEQKAYWTKRLKFMTLERYAEALEEREKNKSKKDSSIYKADTTLERECREKVVKTMNKIFDRLTKKFTEEEKFNLYINTIASVMDPHTTFLPPVEKRRFDEDISRKFYGIGAQLGVNQDGTIKVFNVVTGSPAWKSKEVEDGDLILKVGEGAAEPVDITGFELPDAVGLIRGKKGTEVRLTLKKKDGSIKVISIIRDEIVEEETRARSAIISKNGNKIGYIYLPEFYVDFENNTGASCARDVAMEVQKLKAEKVDGIIMDLRNNPGGALAEVVKMTGLFVDEGPVVQVRNRSGRPNILRDTDKGSLYDGPLAVLINERSASASEIFAAAIQDYKRGIVIGTPSYGKGTVQRSMGIDRTIGKFVPATELGSMHLTIQKFYRVDGRSTQIKGVTPDLLLPDIYEFIKLGEKDNTDALPWDEIAKVSYKQWSNGSDLNRIDIAAKKRIKNSATFELIRTKAAWLAKQNDREYNLNLKKYQEEQKQIKNTVKQIDSLTTLPGEGLSVKYTTLDEIQIGKMDKGKAERYHSWLKALKKDIYLDETINTIHDIIPVQLQTAKK